MVWQEGLVIPSPPTHRVSTISSLLVSLKVLRLHMLHMA